MSSLDGEDAHRERPRVVLHVLRADHATHVGGDLVQLGACVDELRSTGVDARAATIADAPDAVDVVHLYNLQRPAALLHDLRAARRRWPSAAVVLSPVWWPIDLRMMARSGERTLLVRAAKTAVKAGAWWPYLRRVLSTVDLVLPNSAVEEGALRRHFRLRGESTDRWAVVPNGVHLARWPMRRLDPTARAALLDRLGLDPTTTPLVACVARIEAMKNQLATVRAVEQLPRAALVLAGPTGPERYARKVEEAVSQSPAQHRITLVGRLSPQEVSELLAAVDVHVLASFRETPGLATLEAAATGCAVVVTADGSAIEYLGSSAYVADPIQPSSIASAIMAAAADPRQPAARQRVERYEWAAAATALVDAYGRLPCWAATRS